MGPKKDAGKKGDSGGKGGAKGKGGGSKGGGEEKEKAAPKGGTAVKVLLPNSRGIKICAYEVIETIRVNT